MTKSFCDKCQRELLKEEDVYSITGYRRYYAKDGECIINIEICDKCFTEFNLPIIKIKNDIRNRHYCEKTNPQNAIGE